MQLINKTVLVSGANRGIGKSLVEALLKRGVKKIYATARKPEQLPDFNDDRVVPLKLDVTDSQQIKDAAAEAVDIDMLINNAGVAAFSSIINGPMELVTRDMDTNYYGTLNMIREFLPALEQKKDPVIVNVVTIGAFVNFPILGGYCASKAALFSLTQGIRTELSSKNIAVHSVNSGPIDTDMAKDFESDKTSPEETAEGILNGLEADIADIFPDPIGESMFDVWKGGYRDLEKMVAEM